MTKDEIAKEIWGKLDIHYDEAKTILDNVIKILKQSLLNGEDIEIRGFGKFSVRDKKAMSYIRLWVEV